MVSMLPERGVDRRKRCGVSPYCTPASTARRVPLPRAAQVVLHHRERIQANDPGAASAGQSLPGLTEARDPVRARSLQSRRARGRRPNVAERRFSGVDVCGPALVPPRGRANKGDIRRRRRTLCVSRETRLCRGHMHTITKMVSPPGVVLAASFHDKFHCRRPQTALRRGMFFGLPSDARPLDPDCFFWRFVHHLRLSETFVSASPSASFATFGFAVASASRTLSVAARVPSSSAK